MGATVFNDARVLSYKTNNGSVAYLWEENTHCIKQGPKFKSWCAMAFGSKKEMIARIYALAASIPGGMLKVGGRSVPCFIEDMLQVLDRPMQLTSMNVSLVNLEKDNFYSAINQQNRQSLIEAWRRIGRDDLAQQVDLFSPGYKDQITLDLVADYDALNVLFNSLVFIDKFGDERLGECVWKVFGDYPRTDGSQGPREQFYSGAYTPTVEIIATDAFCGLIKSDERKLHVMKVDGQIICASGDDCDMERALIDFCKKKHIQDDLFAVPGAWKRYKKARKEPQNLADATFVFRKPADTDRWLQEKYEVLCNASVGEVQDELVLSLDHLVMISDQVHNELDLMFRYYLNSDRCEIRISNLLGLQEMLI